MAYLFGIVIAWLLIKRNIKKYDFSNDIRKFNWGLQAGGEYKAYKHLAVFANLQWAMNGIFPSDYGSVTFDLYPIYGTLGFTYLF